MDVHTRISGEKSDVALPPSNEWYEWFPSEIVHEIARYCKAKDLAMLACVSRSFQSEAERILYRNIRLDPNRMGESRAVQCLKTLTANHHKAQLLRSFSVLYDAPASSFRLGILARVCKVLLYMTRLNDLNLKLPAQRHVTSTLNAVLRRCTFSLITFSAHADLALASWIKQHTSTLRVVAVDHSAFPSPQLISSFQNLLCDTQVHLLWVTRCLVYEERVIIAFPAFLPPREGISRWSAKLLKDLFCSNTLNSALCINEFHVYIDTLSDEAYLSHTLRSISRHFPRVRILWIAVRDPNIHIYPRSLSLILTAFKWLRRLGIRFWGACREQKHAGQYRWNQLAEDWSKQSPKIVLISFPDDVCSCRDAEGKWSLL